MQDIFLGKSDFKTILLKDEELRKYFLIFLLHDIYKEKTGDFSKNNYDLYEWLLYDKQQNLKTALLNVFDDMVKNDIVDNTMINNVVNGYEELSYNEAKNIIYTLSRLLYIQNKHKDDEIGRELDEWINKWLDYIKQAIKDGDKIKISREEFLLKDVEEQDDIINKLNAQMFYQIIPTLNYEVYNNKNRHNFMDLWNETATNKDIGYFLKTFLKNTLDDANAYYRYFDKINDFINKAIDNQQIANFEKEYQDKIKDLKKDISQEYDKELWQLFNEYKDTKEYKELDQTDDDINAWRKKADTFIKHLEQYKKQPKYSQFDFNYTLSRLAYNNYQASKYKINTIDKQDKAIGTLFFGTHKTTKSDEEKRPNLSRKELKEKYKDITLLKDEKLDYKRKWARVDTSKINSNLIDLRESIAKRLESRTDITRQQIAKIEKKPKKSKDDLKKLAELKEQLSLQEEQHQEVLKEVIELKDDVALIDKQMADITDAKQIKSLATKRRKITKTIQEKEDVLQNKGINFQINMDDKIVFEKTNKRTKENYKLMINADYDIQNFNSEGRNFLYYIPNIPNIIEQLDDDFITIDIMDYLEFTGRPNGSVSRIRKNLQNALKEMRKESYDYTYLDEKGVLHDDSLVIIGDIRGTEYKGKSSIKVQLGATFKANLKQSFIKNQYVKIKKDIFKLGQGKQKKAEKRAQEIFIYLSRLCRIEAKRGTNGGKWQKDLHLDVIITKLCELNLLNYNPNRYNECVKEPLLHALNVGQDLGLFTYKTNAFKYYDDVIASNNNGANVQDKIANFENGKKYGIRFILNNDMIDLDSNNKAHTTYTKHKKKKAEAIKS